MPMPDADNEFEPMKSSVSVVIPHFNRIRLLERALRSIEDQTYRKIDVIVVDDASPVDPTDAISDLGLSIPVRVIVQPRNGGPSLARNAGIMAAQGDFIAFLDSDDVWLPQKIEKQIEAAAKAADPDRVFCIAQTVIRWADRTEARRCWEPSEERLGEYLFIRGGVLQTSSFLMSRSLAQSVLFNPALRQFEDILFVYKMQQAGAEFIFQKERLFYWFRDGREDQLSRSISISAGDTFLKEASVSLIERERLAFLVRFLGPALARQEIWRFFRAASQALLAGVVTPRSLAGIVNRSRFIKIV